MCCCLIALWKFWFVSLLLNSVIKVLVRLFVVKSCYIVVACLLLNRVIKVAVRLFVVKAPYKSVGSLVC